MKIICLLVLSVLLHSTPEHFATGHETRFFWLIAGLVGLIIGASKRTLDTKSLDVTSALFNHKEQETLEHLMAISSKINELEHEIKDSPDKTIAKILHAFPKVSGLEYELHNLLLIINQINFAEEQLQNYLSLSYNKILIRDKELKISSASNSNTMRKRQLDKRIERYTLENYAIWATDHTFDSPKSLLRRLHDLVVSHGDDSLFNLILLVSKEAPQNICALQQSLHQTLYNLYHAIAIAELKGNVILQSSFILLHTYNKGNFTDEIRLALANYKKQIHQKMEVVRQALTTADRSSYQCDPTQYVENVTHTKLTKVLQGYIENEINLNPSGNCRGNCQYYTYTEFSHCLENQTCPFQSQCRGKVTGCTSTSTNMHICTSTNPERRYDWVEYDDGKVLGRKDVCGQKNLHDVVSWQTWHSVRCAYCFCLCDDVGEGSDRYFNLREVTSDVGQNKVVTGLRIVKNNRIVHIQIQQGVLLPFGVVNRTTLSWKPVENYTIDDENVKNNVDYYTMAMSRRIIDTNEMFGPPEHAVTGLRLRRTATHLYLEARVTPINYKTGRLSEPHSSFWLGTYRNSVNTVHGKTEIKLDDPDIPTRKGPHTLNSRFDQYIQFQPTSPETDAAQTTVPYLDSQALTSQGFPLSGLGLIHRGKSGSGGFIAPKLISYDYTQHLHFNTTD